MPRRVNKAAIKRRGHICAYDENLYCAEVRGARFAGMFDLLCLVLPKSDTEGMVCAVNSLPHAYQGRIEMDVMLRISGAMGLELRHAEGD